MFITYVDDGLDLVSQFPNKFWANFRHSDTDYSIKFERVTPHVEKREAASIDNSENNDLYIIDGDTGASIHYETNDTQVFIIFLYALYIFIDRFV